MVLRVGKLKVYWNGRIFVGPDSKGLLLSFILIFLPSVLFLSLIALDIGIGVFLYSFFLVMFCLAMLGLTAFSNPGVIPRGHAPMNGARDTTSQPKTQDHEINGYTITTKYCATCHVFRIPRCSHCAMCDSCVEKFDHYCPWVGTCIGRRNYRFFLLFVFSATVLCISVFSLSLFRLVRLSEHHQHSFERAIGREPLAILLIVYTFIAAWFVGGLTVFHIYLVITNQTTYEHFRRRFGRNGNPYDLGPAGNIWETCFQRAPPYGWEGDGVVAPKKAPSSRSLQIPSGIILDPTLAAMQQEVKAQLSLSQELPPRAPNSQTSEKLSSKPISPCSFGPQPCRVHSTSRECELSSMDYQESIYTTASSNFEDHMQSRMPPVSQSPHARRSSSALERVSAGSGVGQHTDTTFTPTGSQPALPEQTEDQELADVKLDSRVSPSGSEEEGTSSIAEAADRDEEQQQSDPRQVPEEGAQAVLSTLAGQQQQDQSLLGQPPLDPPPDAKTKRVKISSQEEHGTLAKDGPNPFVSGNPFADLGGRSGDMASECTNPRAVASIDGSLAVEISAPTHLDRPENPPNSPTTSAVDSQKCSESPKHFRVMEGGFHGIVAGLTRGRYSELKESPVPESSDTSESHPSFSASSKQGDAHTTPLPAAQFRVPEFASKKIEAAFRSFKSVRPPGRAVSVDESTVGESQPGVVEKVSFGVDWRNEKNQEHQNSSSWKGVLRRGRRQGEVTEKRENLREDDMGADVLL